MDHSSIIKFVKNSIAFIAAFDEKNLLMGTGSGFIFSQKGILVTCNHVVKNASYLLLKFSDSDDFINAKIVLRDEEHDLALLKFDDTVREPLKCADLSSIEEGMPVIFSGYPFSTQNLTTHQGIISAIIKDTTGITSYLIDGTVNSGNSGCPLMNISGEVIGVVNAKRRQRNDLLEKIEKLEAGALSLHGLDLVEIYQALTNNIQLGVGYAVPASYIPEHKDDVITKKITDKKNKKK